MEELKEYILECKKEAKELNVDDVTIKAINYTLDLILQKIKEIENK